MQALNDFILNPANHDLLALIKGLRNGIVYGAKIRFPHALVMTFLFRSQLPFRKKLEVILDATYQHSRNLGTFVLIYKSLLLLQRTLRSGKENEKDAFIAGLIGGYIVFGKDNGINNQIVLYLFSRITLGLVKYCRNRGYFELIGYPSNVSAVTTPNGREGVAFSVFAALTWGIVMWLFRHEKSTLQNSLQASMEYLYNDSDKWNSLKNFLLYNR
ncbi:hypothetical protein MP638_001969 [Amoeboaphelidium occidentale]|nr:hypothetical protein MP638_001969 [Amoeboaphelidium occidentale]